jgi:hypothetical protein
MAGENEQSTSLLGSSLLLWVMAGENLRTMSLEGSSFIVVGDGWRERANDKPRRLVVVII